MFKEGHLIRLFSTMAVRGRAGLFRGSSSCCDFKEGLKHHAQIYGYESLRLKDVSMRTSG
jgi:hypothetical protein